ARIVGPRAARIACRTLVAIHVAVIPVHDPDVGAIGGDTLRVGNGVLAIPLATHRAIRVVDVHLRAARAVVHDPQRVHLGVGGNAPGVRGGQFAGAGRRAGEPRIGERGHLQGERGLLDLRL